MPGNDKRKHQAGTGVVRAQAGQHEDARANDSAHSQRRELKRPKRSLQAVFTRLASFRQKHVQRLSRPEISHPLVLLLPQRRSLLRLGSWCQR